jgi:hypothetical protein
LIIITVFLNLFHFPFSEILKAAEGKFIAIKGVEGDKGMKKKVRVDFKKAAVATSDADEGEKASKQGDEIVHSVLILIDKEETVLSLHKKISVCHFFFVFKGQL